VYEKVYSRTEIRSTSLALKRETIDLSRERNLIILLINNKEFTEAILPILAEKNLEAPYSKLLAGWVREYWDTYHDVPKSSIQDIFELKRAHIEEDSTLETVGEFLKSLSEEYDPKNYTNVKYFIDNSEDYIKERHLKCHIEKVSALTAQGKLDQAEQEIANYKQPGICKDKGVDIFNDIDRIKKAYEATETSLFSIPGDVGTLLSKFYRGDVSVILGGMKAGKSYALQMLSENAAEQGLRVLHLNLEISEDQLIKRFWSSLIGQPDRPGTYDVPYFQSDREPSEAPSRDAQFIVAHRQQTFAGVSFEDIPKIKQGLALRYKGGAIRLFSLPSASTGIPEVESLLDNLQYYDNFVPDVLCIDYPALLNGKEFGREPRVILDGIYKNLRRIAQERHMHITAASQAGRQSLEGEEIGAINAAESVAIIAHGAKVISIYHTTEELEAGIVNIKVDIDRAGLGSYDTVVALQNLNCAKFCIDSRFKSKVGG
jgi:hypothetical protein